MRLVLILSALMLASCATRNVGTNFDFSSVTDSAIIVGSITQTQGRNFGGPYARLYHSGSKKGHIISRTESVPGTFAYSNGDFNDLTGRIFVLEVPPGEFIFRDWAVDNGSSAIISPRQSPVEIKHLVETGQIIYVGNFHFEMVKGKNGFGMAFIAGAIPTVNNNYDKDVGIFRSKYNVAENINVINSLTNIGIWGSDGFNIKVNPVLPSIPSSTN